ncbi:uncharacterized protein LOC110946441 [Acanthochromis polyacanthus]|uniref:uncharacterized protein LOC110946441 n=1 Tax=Acanthochromis polyacanthus TaxID=80966 RepID=UPI0022347245|nr:uncharacterized protein LOC110946441 [Acanthochromis polyacanthus]
MSAWTLTLRTRLLLFRRWRRRTRALWTTARTPQSSSWSPRPPAQRQQPGQEDIQGPDGQPGYQHVLKLAKALVEIWNLQGLSDRRVDRLIALWQRLPEADKRQVVYPARHWERQPTGRFKAVKGKNTSCPGKEKMEYKPNFVFLCGSTTQLQLQASCEAVRVAQETRQQQAGKTFTLKPAKKAEADARAQLYSLSSSSCDLIVDAAFSDQLFDPELRSSSLHVFQVSVGADGATGYQQVVLLARCLVERCRKGYITQAEVEEIVALWQNLPDGDKGPVVYPPRYRSHLTKGRFKKAKSYAPSAAPVLGVESMKRCMVGTGSGPAIWPDTSRLVEAIFIQLCVLHPSSRRTMGCLQSRWTLVLRDYNTIRIVVCTHPALKTRTTLQLFEVNQRTLSQWHKRWTATQERTVLTTAIPLMVAPAQAEETLLPERTEEETPPAPAAPIYTLLPSVTEEEEPIAGPSWAFPATTPTPPAPSTSAPSTSLASFTPKSTAWHRQRLQEMQAEAAQRGETVRVRRPSIISCGHCGQRKIKETGHRVLRKESGERVTFCPVAAKGQSPEEWLSCLK